MLACGAASSSSFIPSSRKKAGKSAASLESGTGKRHLSLPLLLTNNTALSITTLHCTQHNII
eukprot:scaffold4335_cov148-Skeletonema_menzelii.AAC.5